MPAQNVTCRTLFGASDTWSLSAAKPEWQFSWTANDIHDSCSSCKLKAGFNLIVIVRDRWAWPILLIYACSF